MKPPAAEWLGFPRGAWLIIGVEFWERFSFYGMLSILALFLTASPTRGGFGWSAAEALSLVGAYSGAMYAFPALGGYLADRVLGRRRAVTVGATFMFMGQVLLASPVFLAEFLGWWHGAPLLALLHGLGVPLGHLWPSAEVRQAIEQHGTAFDARSGAVWLSQAYRVTSIGFFLAIFCLILGNALMKSTLVVLCGETMSPSDPRREAAYAYYYLGIAVGAMLAGIVVGTVAETFGWHLGFTVAAVGMAVALSSYVLLADRWLGSLGLRPDRRGPRGNAIAAGDAIAAGNAIVTDGTIVADASQFRSEALRRILLILVLAGLLCAFSAGWFQLFGSWSLFVERDVDRALGAFVIPVPWFSSMNAAVVIVMAPFVAALWVRLGARRRRIDIVQKYIFALAMVTVGHLLMCLDAHLAAPLAKAPLWPPLVALALLAIGELVAWTATYGMVSRAAPAGFASVTMGAWYLFTLGLGGYLSGFTGRWVDALGFTATFGIVAALMGSACIAAILLRNPLARLAGRAGVSL